MKKTHIHIYRGLDKDYYYEYSTNKEDLINCCKGVDSLTAEIYDYEIEYLKTEVTNYSNFLEKLWAIGEDRKTKLKETDNKTKISALIKHLNWEEVQ